MLETDGPSLKTGRYQNRKRRDKPAGLLSHHHTRPLRSLKDVLSEQSRVYRAVINGVLLPEEGTKLIFMLREIRDTQAAISIAEAVAIANAPRPPSPPTTINILSVPSGAFVDDAMLQRLNENADSFDRRPLIEHVIEPEPEPAPTEKSIDQEFKPQTERERRLLAELEALSPEQLLERARQAGFVDVDSF